MATTGDQAWGVHRLKKWVNQVHRLFDPSVQGRDAQIFSLKHPPAPPVERPSLVISTQPEAPADTPHTRVKIRAAAAARLAEQALDRLQTDLTDDVSISLGLIKEGLHADLASDLVIRDFTVPFTQPLQAYLIYYDGITDAAALDRAVLHPLMDLARGQKRPDPADLLRRFQGTLIPGSQVQQAFALSETLSGIAGGACTLLLEGVAGALLVGNRQMPGRGVEKPFAEKAVRGPHEAFTETLRVNTALLRRRLMTPDLVFEPARIGRRSRSSVAITYLQGLVNPALVAEVRRRLSTLDLDMLQDSLQLGHLLEDYPFSLFPLVNGTERPDRAAAALAEGRVILLAEGSPYAVIAPSLFGDFFRSPEDYYIKWPFGTALRLIRALGMMITLTLPALYISIANFHQEMIPTSLLMAIAASREAVPFPAAVEVLVMEIAFEIIREGSLRIPSVLGQTVGIVGGLILGQAAVQANIVSPILVIIVATTALGSFTIADYNMGLTARLLRFGFILLGATFGLYGVAAGFFLLSAQASSLRSFGVPYMAPSGPRVPTSPDVLIRGPLYQMDRRPEFTRPLDDRRQAEGVTAWNPVTSMPESGPSDSDSTKQ